MTLHVSNNLEKFCLSVVLPSFSFAVFLDFPVFLFVFFVLLPKYVVEQIKYILFSTIFYLPFFTPPGFAYAVAALLFFKVIWIPLSSSFLPIFLDFRFLCPVIALFIL